MEAMNGQRVGEQRGHYQGRLNIQCPYSEREARQIIYIIYIGNEIIR